MDRSLQSQSVCFLLSYRRPAVVQEAISALLSQIGPGCVAVGMLTSSLLLPQVTSGHHTEGGAEMIDMLTSVSCPQYSQTVVFICAFWGVEGVEMDKM